MALKAPPTPPPADVEMATMGTADGLPPTDKAMQQDLWALPELKNDGKLWADMTTREKGIRVVKNILKLVSLLALLYIFVCSLGLLSSAFRLLGGKSAGQIFANNAVLSNPVACLMLGVLATVLVQSSSTSTSIVVSMVSTEILHVSEAIFVVMGANIGTSVTNSIVAVMHGADRGEYRRAFAAATVHDAFNWLSVLILLPAEVLVGVIIGDGKGFLYHISEEIVGHANNETRLGKIEILKKLTKPLTSRIMQVDKSVIKAISLGQETNKTIAKHYCTAEDGSKHKCSYLLNWDIQDGAIGAVLLVISLVTLCLVLICFIKLLHSILKGSIAMGIRAAVNADFPSPFGFLTGYAAIGLGAMMTFAVQSSSIFTSALTPLVAVGVLTFDRAYPLTLGANIGTTGTAIIAAFASDPEGQRVALQIALCHLLFNIFGITLWYPVPVMRRVPMAAAKWLGTTTARYRWFSVVYLLLVFVLAPLCVMGLSLILHGWLLAPLMGGILLLALFVLLVNLAHRNAGCLRVGCLPACMRASDEEGGAWRWLPEWMRSLEPYDRLVVGVLRCWPAKWACARGDSVAPHDTNGTAVQATM